MAARRSRPPSWATSTRTTTVLLCLLAPTLVLAFDSDFSFYPPKSQPCLNAASKKSGCTGADVTALNKCLCSDGGSFITETARCLVKQSKSDLGPVYSTMSDACSTSKTPITVTFNEFISAANDALTTTTATTTTTRTSTSTTSRVTTTSSSTASVTSAPAPAPATSRGLSKGAIIGIAVGAAVVGISATAGLIMYFIRRRRRRRAEYEAHPMLAQTEYFDPHAPTTFPPTESSPHTGQVGYDSKPAWTASPSPGSQSPGNYWVGQKSPAPQAAAYMSPPLSQQHMQPAFTNQSVPQTYELDGATVPQRPPAGAVEMEGSQPSIRPGAY